MSGCGHFLGAAEQNKLRAYARKPFKYEDEYEMLMNDLVQMAPYAFHTKATLITRRFFHCPRTPIPFYSCLKT